MSIFSGFAKSLVCLVLVFFFSGCTTYQQLALGNLGALQDQLQPGDDVKVMRNDGSSLTFGIDSVTDEGISGDGTSVAWSDMQQIELRQFSAGKTVGLVGGLAAVGLIAAGGGSGGSGY